MINMLIWQRDRNIINHDWLKNNYLIFLNKIIAIFSGQVESSMTNESALLTLAAWEEQQAKITALLMRFENEMSPRYLLHMEPCSRDTRASVSWLEELVHELWLFNNKVSSKQDEALKKVTTVNHCYNEASIALKQLSNLSVNKEAKVKFVYLRNACEDLSNFISSYPKAITVVQF